MSDTPRTDAELKWHEQSARSDAAGMVSGLIMFARELERENARLREALNWLDRWMGGKDLIECANRVREALRDTEAK